MKLAAPKNSNYAAQVFRIGTIAELAGLDNLVAVPALGFQSLTQRGKEKGELVLVFGAETQLSTDYSAHNSLYRDETLNKDAAEKGYLEPNRRIRAIRLRGHTSNALLMPLSSLDYTGAKWWELEEGDVFDSIGGHDICNKYVVPARAGRTPAEKKLDKAFKRVTTTQFPEHLDTDSYFRNKHLLDPWREVVCTAKLHGTSIRVGNVPVLRKKGWLERLVNKIPSISTPDWEYAVIAGSRKVIKDGGAGQNHYYGTDVWRSYGQKIAELLPEGCILYGELVGFTPDGAALQKNYTYDMAPAEAGLYAYRVAHIDRYGHLSDLSWDGTREFCQARGIKTVPELVRVRVHEIDDLWESLVDKRFADMPGRFTDEQLSLSHKKTVDEGICVRQEGLVPLIQKLKSPEFLRHETAMLDKDEVDIESQEAA